MKKIIIIFREKFKIMNLKNLGVQEMNAQELTTVDGGDNLWGLFVDATLWYLESVQTVGDAVVDAAQWTLGLLAGMGDGITDGLND